MECVRATLTVLDETIAAGRHLGLRDDAGSLGALIEARALVARVLVAHRGSELEDPKVYYGR